MKSKFLKYFENIKKRNGGGAMLISVLFFVFISLSIVLGIISPTLNNFKSAKAVISSKQSIFFAESGVEDYYYRLIESKPIVSSCSVPSGKDYCFTMSLGNNSAQTIVDNISSTEKEIIATSDASGSRRKSKMILTGGIVNNLTFQNGGFSVGNGGVVLGAGSTGNGIYSNGPVVGYEVVSGASQPNMSSVDVAYTAGPSGLVEKVAFNEVYSNTVKDSYTSRPFAFCQNSINNTYYWGPFVCNPLTEPEVVSFPIDETIINGFKADALAGGEISTPCPYVVPTGNVFPKKINCDVVFNAGFYTLKGALWVSGNITISPGVSFGVNPIRNNIPVIADNELNRTTSSKIFWNTAEQFGWAPNNNGPFFISKNNSASLGGFEKAIIYTANHPNGDEEIYLYAPDGLISFENSVFADGVLSSAYKINIGDGSNVGFGDGPNIPITPVFHSETLGDWGITSWQEIP